MEENIKKIELFIKRNRIMFEDWGDMEANEYDLRAIENLIKGYRELEQKNRYGIIGRIDAIKIEDLEEVLTPYYISKSKIKEKIEEYQANMKKYEYADKNIFNENNIRQEVITVLQELMEDK